MSLSRSIASALVTSAMSAPVRLHAALMNQPGGHADFGVALERRDRTWSVNAWHAEQVVRWQRRQNSWMRRSDRVACVLLGRAHYPVAGAVSVRDRLIDVVVGLRELHYLLLRTALVATIGSTV